MTKREKLAKALYRSGIARKLDTEVELRNRLEEKEKRLAKSVAAEEVDYAKIPTTEKVAREHRLAVIMAAKGGLATVTDMKQGCDFRIAAYQADIANPQPA